MRLPIAAANDNSPRPATVFLLMAQSHGKAVISVDEICRDYFPHLDSAKFIRKVGAGDIAIPMISLMFFFRFPPLVDLLSGLLLNPLKLQIGFSLLSHLLA